MKIQVYRCTFFLLSLLLSSSVAANEGLNLDLAILKINKEVKTLNSEILALKDEIEILRENQRLNSEKITELLQMIEINQSTSKKTVLGEYEKSIELFLAHLETSPSSLSKTDTLLWLGRAYFYSESFLDSKASYLEYQAMGQDHPKFADSLYELSKVLIELDENVQAKLLLDKMLSEYPSHTLSGKASTLIQNL